MNKPVTITATVAVWGQKSAYGMGELFAALEKGDPVATVNELIFYDKPDREKFSEYVKLGEADVTVRLIPQDERTRMAVQALQDQLTEERVKWHQRQEAILAEISKLQALTFDEAVTQS